MIALVTTLMSGSIEISSLQLIIFTIFVILISSYVYWNRLKTPNPISDEIKEAVEKEEEPSENERIEESYEKLDGPIPQCPFQAIFNDIRRARAAEEDQNQDFVDTQVERDRIIEEKLLKATSPNDDMFLIKQLDNIELSNEERDRELAQRRNQLEAIFELLKKQEQETAAGGDRTKNNDQFEFSVLKEDGSYEKKEFQLKRDFESQMRLYGL